MAKEKWETTLAMDKAIAKVTEQRKDGKLVDWGYNEHLAMIRYMALDCFANAQSMLAKLNADGAKAVPPVQYTLESAFKMQLRLALCDGKLAECANFKKALQALEMVPKETPKTTTYE